MRMREKRGKKFTNLPSDEGSELGVGAHLVEERGSELVRVDDESVRSILRARD